MQRIHIGELPKKINEKVLISGFIQTIRDQGGIKFIVLRDISGIIQVVISQNAELLEQVKQFSLESIIEVAGTVKKETKAFSGIELSAEVINLLSRAEPELPIPVTEKGGSKTDQSKRLDWRFLDLRKPEKQLIFKVWTLMEFAMIEYFISNGFIEIHSPKLMSSPSESGSELFEVKYFERKAFLAQSPQFYKQMAMAAGFEKVFEIGPVFRANPSFTSRHDTEFTGYDFEISYIQSHQDVIMEEQKMIAHVIEKIKNKYGAEILEFYGRGLIVPAIPFPQITMKEAKKILSDIPNISERREGDLSPEEERKLSEYIKASTGHEFVFVTEYPASVRPFYHMRTESDPKLTKSFDLIWNGIEITTGAQREHRYEILTKQAQEKGISLDCELRN